MAERKPRTKIERDYTKHCVYIYAKKVVTGEIECCKTEIQACQRFLDDLEQSKKASFSYVFDTTRADRFFDFARMLKHIEGELSGQPIELEDWQKFDFGNIFGWVEKKTGKRRFTDALIFEPRGCAKSTVTSIATLYCLLSDCVYPPYQPSKRKYELNPEIITLAVDKEQAQIVREGAMNMARLSLPEQADVKKTYITGYARGGKYKSISKIAGGQDGAKPNMIVCDEWAAQKDDKRLKVLVGGLGKKTQGLLIKITTAGDDASIKPAKIDYDYCLDILNGIKSNDHYFMMIRRADESDNVHDISCYKKFTPILRSGNVYARTLQKQIQIEHDKAYDSDSPTLIREFLIKRANLWQVDSEEKYLKTSEIQKLRDSIVKIEEFDKLIKGHMCIAGFDMSKKVDLTAAGYLFKLDDGRYAIRAEGFIPKNAVMNHEKTDQVPYWDWVKKHYVTEIPGDVIDTFVVMDNVVQFESEHGIDIKECAYDPAWCSQFACDMSEGRNSKQKAYTMVEVPQTTARLNEPTQKFVELLMANQLVICENKCFEWCCENAYVVEDKGGRQKIAKKDKDSPQRIDLLAAVLFAMSRIDTLNNENIINALNNGCFSF